MLNYFNNLAKNLIIDKTIDAMAFPERTSKLPFIVS
jgi:hypothetical protein